MFGDRPIEVKDDHYPLQAAYGAVGSDPGSLGLLEEMNQMNPIVDLTSSNNILDTILNSLQGMTPEQEAVKR